MYIGLSLIVAIIGALFYLLSPHPERKNLGLVAFGCGLLAFLIRFSSESLTGMFGHP